MKTEDQVSQPSNIPKHVFPALAMGLAATAAFLAGGARADTTILSGQTVQVDNNPIANFFSTAGTVTMNDTATLFLSSGGAQSPPPVGYVITNGLVFAGNAGNVILRFDGNDTRWDFAGPISGTASGNQIIEIHTGNNDNGDREDVVFGSPVPNGSSGTIATSKINTISPMRRIIRPPRRGRSPSIATARWG